MRYCYHLFLAVVAGLVAGLVLRVPMAAAAPDPAHLVVESLTLRDTRGTVRATLSLVRDNPVLRILGTTGKPALELGAVTDEGFVFVCDETGESRLSLLTTKPDGGIIVSRTSAGKTSAYWP